MMFRIKGSIVMRQDVQVQDEGHTQSNTVDGQGV